MFWLIIESREGQVLLRHPLAAKRQVIGRGKLSDIVVHSSYVSRNHAALEPEGDTFVVVDLGSSNGTFLNDVRLGPNDRHALSSGDEVGLGRAVSCWFLAESALDGWQGRYGSERLVQSRVHEQETVRGQKDRLFVERNVGLFDEEDCRAFSVVDCSPDVGWDSWFPEIVPWILSDVFEDVAAVVIPHLVVPQDRQGGPWFVEDALTEDFLNSIAQRGKVTRESFRQISAFIRDQFSCENVSLVLPVPLVLAIESVGHVYGVEFGVPTFSSLEVMGFLDSTMLDYLSRCLCKGHIHVPTAGETELQQAMLTRREDVIETFCRSGFSKVIILDCLEAVDSSGAFLTRQFDERLLRDLVEASSFRVDRGPAAAVRGLKIGH